MKKKEFFEEILSKIDLGKDEKIIGIEGYKANLKYRKTFRIATGEWDYSQNLIIVVRTDSGWGIGEGVYSREIVEEWVDKIKSFKNMEILEVLEKIYNRAIPDQIRLPLSMAIFDAISRSRNMRYGDVFSENYKNFVETDVTIGLKPVKEFLEEFRMFIDMGFRVIKVKMGDELKVDLGKLEAMGEEDLNGVRIRLDANQGWNMERAKKVLETVNRLDLPIELIEQPFPKDEFEKIPELKKFTNIPIFVDESVRKSEDILRVEKFVDGVNLKPTKAGDVIDIVYGYRIAKSLGLRTMIGCSGESNIGISSSAYIAAAERVEFADLDSDILLAQDTVKEKICMIRDGKRLLPKNRYGLGIVKENLNWEVLEKIF